MKLRQLDMSGAKPIAPATLGKAKISVIGLGYVGAVSTACLADLGHQVIGVDIDRDKVDQITAGISPIYEEGLGEKLREGVARNLISATDDLSAAVRETDVSFISVGTPTSDDGGCDYSFIEQAARSMAVGLRQKTGFHVFVLRCSIPPGTTMKVMAPILEGMSEKVVGRDFGICFNPEFLREGVAIDDFFNPPKTVIGTTDFRTADIMRRIYAQVDASPIMTTIDVAEMVKYVDNVWHATKVCFANEVGRLCKSMEIDSHDVMNIFTRDLKLNLSPYYLKPGFAYGGSCLPKEVRAVQHIAEQMGVSLPLIGNLDRSNQEQVAETVRMVRATGAKRVGILGLAFKPGTDDMRESPILEVMAALREDGIELTAHDCVINRDTRLTGLKSYARDDSFGHDRIATELADILRDSADEVLAEADAVIVCHNNEVYKTAVQSAPRTAVIDVVRLFDKIPENLRLNGIGW